VTGHIFIYDYIGRGLGEVSTKTVKSQMSPTYDSYVVHINSGGGDVFEGFGIYNLLKNSGKNITTQIEGVCASIATLVAGAGDKIIMNKIGQFIVHNPFAQELKGDARVLRNVADQLDQMKAILMSIYSNRTGLSIDELSSMYDKETSLTSQQALSMGFIDAEADAMKAVARINIPTMKETPFAKFLSWIRPKVQTQFKNQVTETIEGGDLTGQSVVVMAEDGDWMGKEVILESGERLPAGTYKLASGNTITVDGEGLISDLQKPSVEAAVEEPEIQNEMNKDQEIEALKAQLTALQAEKETAAQAAQAATAAIQNQSAQFMNKLTAMEAQMEKFKTTTVGDQSAPKRGPAFKNIFENERYDPMADHIIEVLKSRNAI
jgi:ATP-dependent protease ClpP protease subunit